MAGWKDDKRPEGAGNWRGGGEWWTMVRETEGTSHCWACWDLGFKTVGNSYISCRSHRDERRVAVSSPHGGMYLFIDILIL